MRTLRQRLTLEEYGVKIIYIPENTNVAADALSRLPFSSKPSEEINTIFEQPLPPFYYDRITSAFEQDHKELDRLLSSHNCATFIRLHENESSLYEYKNSRHPTPAFNIYVPPTL